MCGLKLLTVIANTITQKSHPSWVCGLKLAAATVRRRDNHVTPFVGVWIETIIDNAKASGIISHTLRGCVD